MCGEGERMPDEGGQRSTWRTLSAVSGSMLGSMVVLLCALFGAVGCGGTTDNNTEGGFKCDNDEACYEYGQYCLGGRCAQCLSRSGPEVVAPIASKRVR